MTARADKAAAMDREAEAWRKLAAHLQECDQKGKPLLIRNCCDCRRLHAAHQSTCNALHRFGSQKVGVLSNMAGLFI